MSDVAIRVAGLGKQYRLGGTQERYHTLGDQFRKWTSLRRLLSRRTRDEKRPPFWALKDVSFEVKRGEVVGVIGRNGAGKSTLLKILSRITEPTEGEVDIHGRVGSLLEVGTGFHPELTGRENVYLNGAILGMRRSEIVRKFDEIVAFAEVEKFIDTPVKHYSSGMYMRLAFAVAAHLEPEILIVDEVLAVGDAEFQKKCLGKMGDVAKGGRTVLFVSHNMGAVQALCCRVLRLADGRVAGVGSTAAEVAAYLSAAVGAGRGRIDRSVGPHLRLLRLGFEPGVLAADTPTTFVVSLRASAETRVAHLCGLVYSPLDIRVGVIDLRSDDGAYLIPAGATLTVRSTVRGFALVPGTYNVGLHLVADTVHSDFRDLTTVEVVHSVRRSAVVPYPAAARGLVEFETDQPVIELTHGCTS